MRQLLLTICLLTLSASGFAATLKVGDKLPAIELPNQHDKAIVVAQDVRTILFSIEKASSDLINDFLMQQDKGYLDANNAYFIANISAMPAMITRMFAKPKMRKRPFDILLGSDEGQLEFMPHKKNFATILKISGGEITSIEFVENAEKLAKAFR